MEPFTAVRGAAAPLLLENVDTDVITPMGRLVGGAGNLVKYAFEELRYLDEDVEDPGFVLNRPAYREAPILLCGPNFGCGSSRETAVWALRGLGFRCLVAPSFGAIFFQNCFQNGVLPIVLPREVVESLAGEARAAERGDPAEFSVDLERCEITTPAGHRVSFEVNPMRREALLAGRDDVAMTLGREEVIAAFQRADRERRPWIYPAG